METSNYAEKCIGLILFIILVMVIMYVRHIPEQEPELKPWKSSIKIKVNKDGEAIKARLNEIDKEIDEKLRIYEERNGPGHCLTCGNIRSLRAKTCVHCGAP